MNTTSEIDTIPRTFQSTVARLGTKTALRQKVGREWIDISYAELARRVEVFASGLSALGIGRGDRVALLSENRPEWAIADLAILHIGAIVIPIYPSLPAPQVAYIVGNSEAKALIVSDGKQYKKAIDARASLLKLQHLIVMDPPASGVENGVRTFESIAALGETNPIGSRYTELWHGVRPDEVASFVYTSGTTGDPKGAMLTHANFAINVRQALEHFAQQGEPITESDTFLSFLPLCHVFERTAGYYLPLAAGSTIAYSEGVRTLLDDMQANKPTIMVCVPRVYESFQERILDTVSKQPETHQKVFRDAIAAGEEYGQEHRDTGHVGPAAYEKHAMYDKMVYSTLREKFGGHLRFFVSGGAALNQDTARFFYAIGMPILEGYGLTETSPVISVNPNRRVKIGTVGICMPNGAIRIAPDGEILYRGPNVMLGYWNNDVATAEMIDSEGWLHTGDIGLLDEEGYLKITDRKKDIIVLANGKNVAPQPIELSLKTSPFIGEIVLIGDKQNIVTALVVPNLAKVKEWAASEGLEASSDDALLALPETRKKIKSEIDAHSVHLADFERVKKFALINAVFSVDGGELTPTLKIKRKVVLQKYAREVSLLRGDGETSEAG